MEEKPEPRTVSRGGPAALFIDFENIYFTLVSGAVRLPPERAVEASLDTLVELRRSLRGEGWSLEHERAYADWEKLPQGVQRQLQVSGVGARYVDSRVGKSSSDIEMTLDILELALGARPYEGFFIVGGDRDYMPIIRRLRERRHHVSICAWSSSLASDIRALSEQVPSVRVVELDKFVDLKSYAPAVPPRPAALPALTASSDHERLVRYAAEMVSFMTKNHYTEIYLGPFFRHLVDDNVFPDIPRPLQKASLDELQKVGAIRLTTQQGETGFPYTVAAVDWNHPIIKEANGG